MIYNIKNKLRDFSHKSSMINYLYKKANTVKVNMLAFLNDETFAKIKYRENTGRKLNLKNPTTFNEKIWWLKIYNKDPLLTKCSDKIEVREYIREKGLQEILNPLIKVYNSPEEIDFSELPSKAFIKVNHSSGTNFLWDREKCSNFDRNEFNYKFQKALKSNYYLQSRENNYKNIKPYLFAEKYIEVNDPKGLVDYRFFCFDGNVKLIQVDIDVASEDGLHNPYSRRNIYDSDFNLIKGVKAKREPFPSDYVEKPSNFNKMKKYAEILAEPFPFCRVDLYNINGEILFGEMTFYPGGGTQIFSPQEWEVKLGSYINLNSDKIIF